MSTFISDLILILGGVKKTADAVGIRAPSVIGWRYRGHIPSKRIPQIIEAAKRLDPPVRLEPNDFFQLEDVK